MPATPEALKPEMDIQEVPSEFIVPETLGQSDLKVVQKNFTAQVKGDNGAPLIQTPPTQVISVTPPSDQAALTQQSKGSISSSLTWLAMFWLRIIKKAAHFGWQIVSSDSKNPPITN